MPIPWEDTLAAHHCFASHFPQRLDWVASEYCDAGPWKIKFGRKGQEEKGTLPVDLSGEDLCKYNAADCRMTVLAWQRMQTDLAKEAKVYEADKRLSKLCQKMIVNGIGVDHSRRKKLQRELERRSAELVGEMQKIARNPYFNPASSVDCRQVLFEKLKAEYTTLTPGGKPSTSDAALESLQGVDSPAGKFAEALLTWRTVDKVKSTYVDILDPQNVDHVMGQQTGRAHYNWKNMTVSGRLNCRLQSAPRYAPNLPEKRVRELYVPSPGNEFVYFDVAQAEMRIAAHLSGDLVFIESCSKDVHAGNARIIFPELAAKGWLEGDALKDPERGKPYRDISKNMGFAVSYCGEAETGFTTLRRKGFPTSLRAVQVFIGRLHNAYRVYYHWVEKNLDFVRKNGYIRGFHSGRIRWLGWFPSITDVANYPIQEFLASIVNERMACVDARQPPGVKLVAQVHDACIYDVPKKFVAQMREIISEIWAEEICLYNNLKMLLPIDLKVGSRWSDL